MQQQKQQLSQQRLQLLQQRQSRLHLKHCFCLLLINSSAMFASFLSWRPRSRHSVPNA